jgi:hypothetical protein
MGSAPHVKFGFIRLATRPTMNGLPAATPGAIQTTEYEWQ